MPSGNSSAVTVQQVDWVSSEDALVPAGVSLTALLVGIETERVQSQHPGTEQDEEIPQHMLHTAKIR